ncbi:MAG: hypothetical protein LBU57_04505 [Dysgonamonadaceae bacterium]|jgi:hypothetical protein|nr:hypothetical protein [Dysgonamonadaceae bacterium]
MERTANTNRITVREVRAYKASMTSSKEASRDFLERVGVLKDGKIAPAYKENKTKVSYRYGKV